MTAPVPVEELRRLLEKATPGPWEMEHHPEDGPGAHIHGPFSVRGDYHDELSPENAAFIVALVNNADALLSAVERVERLTEILREMKDSHDHMATWIDITIKQYPSLRFDFEAAQIASANARQALTKEPNDD